MPRLLRKGDLKEYGRRYFPKRRISEPTIPISDKISHKIHIFIVQSWFGLDPRNGCKTSNSQASHKKQFFPRADPKKKEKTHRKKKKKDLSLCIIRVISVTCVTTTLALINCKTAYFPFSYSQAYKKKKNNHHPQTTFPQENTPDYPNLN